YASLAEFYNKGGNVGIKTEFKGSEDNASGLDSVDDKESKNTGKYGSIAEYNLTHMQMVNDTKRQDKSILDGTTDWALHGKYDTGSQVNSRKKYEKGIHAGTSLFFALCKIITLKFFQYFKIIMKFFKAVITIFFAII
ncbi:hypothetical protein, partial [Helicobacter bilis]|uniref:hypothetical protein n=2 Tax=Helicobacter bilis TaxID=37372 RepID=UPI00188361AD